MSDDLISRQKAIDTFYNATADGDKAEWCDYILRQIPSAQDEKKGEAMSEIVREMTREELVAFNNELRAENEKLKAELQEARHIAEENQFKYALYYRDGVIYGMKYALKCNGISGGEVDR